MLAISTMNISAGQTVANLVTVYATISFQNKSQGTLQVVADLDGYYSNAGSGFQPVTPVRVAIYNGSSGSVQIIVDQEGDYIDQP